MRISSVLRRERCKFIRADQKSGIRIRFSLLGRDFRFSQRFHPTSHGKEPAQKIHVSGGARSSMVNRLCCPEFFEIKEENENSNLEFLRISGGMASTKDITSVVTSNMRKHLAKQKWKVISSIRRSDLAIIDRADYSANDRINDIKSTLNKINERFLCLF